MTGAADQLLRRADELRREFDRAFAAPADRTERRAVDLVLLEMAGDVHAVRVSEIAGLYVDVKVTPCPSPAAALLGLAAFRGAVMPVYDLARLIGYPAAAAPRWMITAAAAPVALAFDRFAGHMRIAPEAIAPRRDAAGTSHVRDIAQGEVTAWPLVSVTSVATDLRRQISRFTEAKE